MNATMNLLHNTACVYDQGDLYPFATRTLVRERASGYALPEPDAYARRMAERAEAWLSHARERSRMKDDTLVSKALHALAFSLRHRAHDLAIPSKLSGTSKHQPALWRLVRSGVAFGTALDVEEVKEGKRVRVVVRYDDDVLGEVQARHVSWLRPLIPFGAGLFLTRVTGHEASYTLGLNVALGRVGSAVEALYHALGADLGTDAEPAVMAGVSGDGIGGDGVPEGAVSGDGAAGHLRLVSPAPSVAKPKGDTLAQPDAEPDPDDVVLARAIDGMAGAMRRGRPLVHAVRHSPTGMEWGYAGSGPADLARSVLLAFTDEATAEAHYHAFKAEVVAAVPEPGGVIRASGVRAWLASRGAR